MMKEVFRKHSTTIILGVAILTYLVLRAWIVPLSDDEYLTYREHVNRDLLTILTNGNPDVYWAPNNHILNTLLIKLSLWVFGEHDWAFRIHILLAFIVCVYFVFKLLSGFVSSPRRITAYMGIFFLNPYLLDFFSIARGYAMSMAGWAAATYFISNYFQQASWNHLRNTVISLFLAIWANFSAIYFLPVFGLLFVYHFFQNRKKTYVVKHFIFLSIGFLMILGAVVLPIKKALAAGTLTWGSGSFFQDTFVAYVDYYCHYNFDMGRFDKFSSNWSKMEVYALAMIVFWVLWQIVHLRFSAKEEIRRLYFITMAQCVGLAAIVLLLHALFGTAYPYHRTVLLYTFPFILCLVLAIENLIPHFKMVKPVVYLMFAFCVWHSAKSWNVENTMEWYQNGDAKRVFAYFRDEVSTEGTDRKLVLGAEAWQYFSMAFYAETEFKDRIILKFTDLSKEETFDYFFVPKHLKDSVWAGYMPVKEFKHGILFKHEKGVEGGE